MKVALDATPLTLTSGGLLRYARELSAALAREFPEDGFFLVCGQPFQPPHAVPTNLQSGQPARGWIERRWWLAGVQREMRRLGCELFHGTNFVVPWLPFRPSVVTVHDLSPWMDRGWQEGADFVRRRTPLQIKLGLADMILTPSEAVRRLVLEWFGAPQQRVVVTPLAASRSFRPREGRKAEHPYFLYVGALEPRKNLGMLLDVWREVRGRTGADLVLIGPRREDLDLRLDPEPGLRVLGEVAEEELPAWYCGAAAVAYPSLYEGFGLPVLEAMQCGTVAMASRIPAIEEVAGDAAVLLDPWNRRAWVEAMTAAVENPGWAAAMGERGRKRAALFSWERTARLTREAYREVWQRRRG